MGLSCGGAAGSLLTCHVDQFSSWLLFWGMWSRIWFLQCSKTCISSSSYYLSISFFNFTLPCSVLPFISLSCSTVVCYGFIELVCGRNFWIKVISICLRFSQDVKLPFTFVCLSERDSKQHMLQTHTVAAGVWRQQRGRGNLKDTDRKLHPTLEFPKRIRLLQPDSSAGLYCEFMCGRVIVMEGSLICNVPCWRARGLNGGLSLNL